MIDKKLTDSYDALVILFKERLVLMQQMQNHSKEMAETLELITLNSKTLIKINNERLEYTTR